SSHAPSHSHSHPSTSSFQSPQAIPPRTSSTGHHKSLSQSSPSKAGLRAVTESDWLSPGRRVRKLSTASTSFLVSMQPTTPPDPNRYATDDLNFAARKLWSEEKEKVLTGPFDYMYGHKGKEFRTQLINAFNVWLDVPAESLEIITKVVGML